MLNRNDLVISCEDVEVIKGVVEILEPFEAVTREISADQYLSGPEVQKLVDTLLHKMNRKFLNMEDNMLLAVPTLLDPRFKKVAFSNFGIAASVAQYVIREIAASLRLHDEPPPNEVKIIVKDMSHDSEDGDKAYGNFLISR